MTPFQQSTKKTFDRMLQGLAYWLAYQYEVSYCKVIESDAVREAYNILQSHLKGYTVEKEVLYKIICPQITNQMRADLAIKNDAGDYECIIEFKLASATNKGYKGDLSKMLQLKKIRPEIECYSIILFQNSCKQYVPKDFITPKGNAIKRTLSFPCTNNSTCNYRVRRICNAVCSKKAEKMKKVVLLELM